MLIINIIMMWLVRRGADMQRKTPANLTIELFDRAEYAFDRSDNDNSHLERISDLYKEVIRQLEAALSTVKSKDNYYYLSCSYRELAWLALRGGDVQLAMTHFEKLLTTVDLGKDAAANDWAITFHYNMLIKSVLGLCNQLIEQTNSLRESSGRASGSTTSLISSQYALLNSMKRHLENRDVSSCVKLISDKSLSKNLNSLFAHRFSNSCPSFVIPHAADNTNQVRRLVV